MRGIPRPRGRPGRLVVGYLGIVALANLAIWVGVAVARALGHAPQVDDGLPDIKHIRRIDSRIYASGQPEPKHYQRLADQGFSLVIDLRTGTRGDQRKDDPALLRSLGVDYVHIPVCDGRAPGEEAVRRLLAAIAATGGKVLVHCGGGVGRSAAMAASYRAAQGVEPSLLDQLAVGPPTLEQLYFGAAASMGLLHAGNDLINLLSRVVVDGPRRLWHAIARI